MMFWDFSLDDCRRFAGDDVLGFKVEVFIGRIVITKSYKINILVMVKIVITVV